MNKCTLYKVIVYICIRQMHPITFMLYFLKHANILKFMNMAMLNVFFTWHELAWHLIFFTHMCHVNIQFSKRIRRQFLTPRRQT